jgi:DNA-binding winged helix-turn-helix (wHTH) protein/tetratricopeptide (TPR) repeat protein
MREVKRDSAPPVRMASGAAALYRFGEFTLDAGRAQLNRGDSTVALRPKTFDVLACLVRNAGRTVGREELMQAVWRDVIVSDDSLVQCIVELRSALGAQGRGLIRTIHRRGYLFDAAVTEAGGPAVPGSKAKSLAVLPFQLLTAAGDEDRTLALGMADALILRLSGTGRIVVRPTSAIMRYATTPVAALAAGRELEVDWVLEGRIQRAGNRLRITAQLINPANGQTLWTDKFDEEMTNIFSVQDSIAEKAAASLVTALGMRERQGLSRRDTTSFEAYEAYLKGRFFWAKRTESDLKASIDYFGHAIRIDPGYALAHAGTANSYNVLGAYGLILARDAFKAAKEAALRALELDNRLAEAHASLAFARAHHDHDWTGAEQGYREAIELDPHYATAHQWLALAYFARGRFEAGLGESRAALSADPLSLIVNTTLGNYFYYSRQFEQAIVQLRKTMRLDPGFVRAHYELGRTYIALDRYDLAIAELERAASLSDRSAAMLAALGRAYALAGSTPEALRILDELADLAQQRYVSAFHFAVLHVGLGNPDIALGCLERAYEERFNWLVFINVDQTFDPVRSEARFARLVRRLGVSSS